MLGCAKSVVEHATHYARRSASSSYIWYDHRKFYDKNLVLLPLFCCGQRAIRFHGCTFIHFHQVVFIRLKHNQDLESLIKLFAAFAFADQKSLGFDPTMEMCEDDQKQTQFIISVHPHDKKQQSRKFRTLRLISSYGAEPLRGRGTRVFKVIEIDQSECYKGLPVVLKDIWIDNDRTKEGFILEQLHLEADDEDKQLVERHFLNTVCHGYVWTDDATLDDTNNTLMRGLDLTTYKTFKLQKGSLQRYPLATGSEGLLAVSRFRAPHSHARYSPKTHYRIVFEEDGITIDRITSLPEVMKALTETARGASLYDMIHPWALTLLLCSFTTVAQVGVGAP
jgi:hypothetical protein